MNVVRRRVLSMPSEDIILEEVDGFIEEEKEIPDGPRDVCIQLWYYDTFDCMQGAGLETLFFSAGLSTNLRVLYVPTYSPPEAVSREKEVLFREIGRCLPQMQIIMSVAQGPFEDDHGDASWVDKATFGIQAPETRKKKLKVDLATGICQLLRFIDRFKPQVVFGDGQGAIMALGISKPGLVERVLQSRNMQREEIQEVAHSVLGKCTGCMR